MLKEIGSGLGTSRHTKFTHFFQSAASILTIIHKSTYITPHLHTPGPPSLPTPPHRTSSTASCRISLRFFV